MALIPAPPLFSKYILLMDNSEVKLTVTVGFGQMSSASYSLKPTIKEPPTQEGTLISGEVKVLGKDMDLHKQRLSILVTVGASASLDTAINIKLAGGEIEQEWTMQHRADQIGDVVAFEAYIRMTKS
jgi:hypothetical protein